MYRESYSASYRNQRRNRGQQSPAMELVSKNPIDETGFGIFRGAMWACMMEGTIAALAVLLWMALHHWQR